MTSGVSSDVCSDGALRLSRNHASVLDVVRTLLDGEHAGAHEIFVRARATHPRLGFATVHRALIRLYELGLISKVDVPGAVSAIYEPTGTPHAHFRCSMCGDIRDVAFQLSADQREILAAQLGLQIAAESLTFAGRCAACLQRESSATGNI